MHSSHGTDDQEYESATSSASILVLILVVLLILAARNRIGVVVTCTGTTTSTANNTLLSVTCINAMLFDLYDYFTCYGDYYYYYYGHVFGSENFGLRNETLGRSHFVKQTG